MSTLVEKSASSVSVEVLNFDIAVLDHLRALFELQLEKRVRYDANSNIDTLYIILYSDDGLLDVC